MLPPGERSLARHSLAVENLLRSENNLSCANSNAAGNLGVFFEKIRGEHHLTAESVETRTMVFDIQGEWGVESGGVPRT